MKNLIKPKSIKLLNYSFDALILFICKYGLYFCLSAFIFFSFYFISFAVDDSFIYLRYGKVLLETGEWNWNPGLPKIEAYTGILYAILGIIPAFLNFPPIFF